MELATAYKYAKVFNQENDPNFAWFIFNWNKTYNLYWNDYLDSY